MLPLKLFGNLGRNAKTNKLYWDGEALVTERRFSNFERWLAVVALLIAVTAAGAELVQAYAALQSLS